MENAVITKCDVIEALENNTFSHEDKVQLFALLFVDLEINTISGYADLTGKSYNGIKKFSRILKLNPFKFVIPSNKNR